MCVYIPTVAAYTDAFLIATTILPTADPRLHGEVHPLHVLGGGSGCVCNTDVLLISICILLVARQPDSDQDRSSALSRTNLPFLPLISILLNLVNNSNLMLNNNSNLPFPPLISILHKEKDPIPF